MSPFYLMATGLLTPIPPPPQTKVGLWKLEEEIESSFSHLAYGNAEDLRPKNLSFPNVELSSLEFSSSSGENWRRGVNRSDQSLFPADYSPVPTPSAAPQLLAGLENEPMLLKEKVRRIPALPPSSALDISTFDPVFSAPRKDENPFIEQEQPAPPVLTAPARKPTSGNQLYRQRITSLKAGRIYTRLPANSFQSSWAKTSESPTYPQWKLLLEQEAKAIAQGQGKNRLSVLVGDSLTMWFPQEELPSRSLWLNQGISGENSHQISKRLSAFSQTRPDAIYVMAGINDLRQGATDQVILNNLRQMMGHLRRDHPQAQVVIQSILPTRLATVSNDRIRYLNEQIAAIAEQEGANYLDLHSFFTDAQGNLNLDLTTDGLHLNRRGYEVWQFLIQQNS